MEDKLKKLFEAARVEKSPVPSNTFADRVVSALSGRETEMSYVEQIAIVARKILVPAMALVLISIAVEYYFSSGSAESPADTAQLTEEWLFTLN